MLRRGSLALWMCKRRKCHQNTSAKLSGTMETCQAANIDMTSVCTWVPLSSCLMLCLSCWRTCLCPGNRSGMCRYVECTLCLNNSCIWCYFSTLFEIGCISISHFRFSSVCALLLQPKVFIQRLGCNISLKGAARMGGDLGPDMTETLIDIATVFYIIYKLFISVLLFMKLWQEMQPKALVPFHLVKSHSWSCPGPKKFL